MRGICHPLFVIILYIPVCGFQLCQLFARMGKAACRQSIFRAKCSPLLSIGRKIATQREMCSFQTCPAGESIRHATIHVSVPLKYRNFSCRTFACAPISHFCDLCLCSRSGQGDTDYHGSNGQADTHSLHSSHLSVQEDPLLIRTHKQQTSQQVSRPIPPDRTARSRDSRPTHVTRDSERFPRDFKTREPETFF